jgi:hypothetical protein
MVININGKHLEIPALDNPEVYSRYLQWKEGQGLIQEMLPELNADEREFLITGMLPEEWDELFKDD